MKELEDAIPAHCKYDYVENFVITKEFLTKQECDVLVRDAKQLSLYDAEVEVKKGPVKTSDLKEEIRDSKIHFINYDNTTFDWFFPKILQTLVNVNTDYFDFDILGFQEDLQFTEYNAPSGHYSDHTDKLLQGNVRKLSMVVQLTDPDEYEGGELELCLGGEPFVVPREQGTLITFPSYVLHRVKPTTKGTRHSLVGWVTGRPFR
ncbi:2OG-Fe(II) oxygenase [bacterium]|jgi:PKHD-type hydroxylase|nr:2OG-Fe(II) oxygenase [bacterium]